MTTKTLEITNFVEFHAILSSKPLDVGRWIYRGHADSNWPLIPKKGRDKYHDACEEEMIKQWQTFLHFYLFEQNHMDTNSPWSRVFLLYLTINMRIVMVHYMRIDLMIKI